MHLYRDNLLYLPIENEIVFMNRQSFLYKVYDLYYDGFRHMRLGRTLWTVILIKLFIIFVVLKLFFFPNFLKEHAKDGDKAGYVAGEMIERMNK